MRNLLLQPLPKLCVYRACAWTLRLLSSQISKWVLQGYTESHMNEAHYTEKNFEGSACPRRTKCARCATRNMERCFAAMRILSKWWKRKRKRISRPTSCRSAHRPAHRTTGRSTCRSVYCSMGRSICRSTRRSTGRSTCRSAHRFTGRLACRSAHCCTGRFTCHSATAPCVVLHAVPHCSTGREEKKHVRDSSADDFPFCPSHRVRHLQCPRIR